MEREILTVLMRFIRTAGRVAMERQKGLAAELKKDDSYVTEVDLELSTLAMKLLGSVIPAENIVTEEHLENLYSLTGNGGPKDAELIAFIDPIDGTRNYFHDMPLYGISVGILRNLEPWIGVVAFPALGEIFYCDGAEAWMIHDAFGLSPVERKLSPVSVPVDKNSVMLFSNSYSRAYRWSYDVCTWIVSACVAINVCWLLVCRGVGTVLTDHIWDFAGGWPMLKTLGFELRGFESGRTITRYDPADYDPEDHTIREPTIVCRPEHFEILRRGIIPIK